MTEPSVETSSSFRPQPEISQILQGMEKHIMTVITAPAKVSRDTESDSYIFDAELPIVGGNVYSPEATKVLARILASGDRAEEEIRYFAFKTGSGGRSDYFYPVFFGLSTKRRLQCQH